MKKIGIIGAEGKHTEYFGTLFNIDNRFKGYRVDALWGGDAPDKISDIASMLNIENICSTYDELIDASDAVMVVQRRGSDHFEPAMLALEALKPVFVDKPFATDIHQAAALLDYAAKAGVPIFGGSTLKFLPDITKLKVLLAEEKADTIVIRYQADSHSIYDGFWFYGSHLAELCIALCGTEYSQVEAVRDDAGVAATAVFPHVKAILNSSPGHQGLHISLLGKTVRHINIDETDCYLHGMVGFVDMLETKKPPIDYSHYVASTRLLADIIRSYQK